jgi:hypothetical protein
VAKQPVAGGGLSAARRHAGLAEAFVSRRWTTALAPAQETFVALIELARTDVPATLTITDPAQRVATGTPAAVADGAQSAAAQASASSRGRMGPHSPPPRARKRIFAIVVKRND